MRRNGGILWAWLALLLTVRSGVAVADVVHMAGRAAYVRQGRTVRFIAVPSTPGESFELPAADPTLLGGRITFLDADDPDGNDVAYDLPVQASPRGWRALGTRGYAYRGAGTASDPCRTVVVKRRVVKAACRGDGVTLTNPVSGALHVALTIGTASDRYCAAFGGTEIRNDGVLKRAHAPAPAACGCGAVPPTELRFASRAPSGPCGILTTTGDPVDLDCGLLYFGGGQVGTPPFNVTDMEDPTTLSVDCCSDKTLILGPSPQEISGPKRCSREGCLFGPPMVVPNPNSPPQSVCVYPVYTDDARGVARCDTGEVRITLPIAGVAFLTGDILPRRCSGGSSPGLRCANSGECPDGGTCVLDPTLQPCPICNPVTGVCNGGTNNGMACVPGGDEVTGSMFPTSRDCTVTTLVKVADIPLPLSLTTATTTKTKFASGTQQRVFCGFCRDRDFTTGFEEVSPGVARPCTSDADCQQPYEACEQRNDGAFAHPALTISQFGAPAGSLEDFALHDATLVSVFCLPPTFVSIIDGPSDLPGPGAVSFQGRVQLGSAGGAFTDAVSPPAPRW